MDDERTLREIDARVRRVLTPDAAAADRVTRRALANRPRRNRLLLLRYSVAAAGALVVVAAGIRHWRNPPIAPTSPSLSVVGRGSTVIVESADGRRWLLEPAQERRPSGNYVIVLAK